MSTPTNLRHPLTLAISGGSDMDLKALNAIFILAGSALKTPWRLIRQEPVDIILVITDSDTGADSPWRTYLTRYPVERLIAFGGENIPHEAYWRLPRRAAGQPPSLREFTQLLNNIAEQWIQPASKTLQEEPPAGEAALFDPDAFVPETRLLGLLQQITATGKACRIALAEGPEIHVVPEEEIFLSRSTIEDLLPLCVVERGSFLVEPLTEPEAHSGRAEQGYRKNPLKELIWFAALAGSQGRLLAGCRLDDLVHLNQWPDFAKLPYYSEYQELALYMTQQAATLTDIAAAFGVPLGQAIDFHNACATLGLIKHGAAAADHVRKKSLHREHLSNAFGHLAKEERGQRVVKVLITGSVGAGKTTSILESSDDVPVLTEARPSDGVSDMKATTTVAMDYGEMRLPCGVKVQLLGTPGQRRFEFMGQILSRGLWGLVVLIDHTAPDPLDDLVYYLTLYREFLPSLQLAIAVTHYEHDPTASLEPYRTVLKERGIGCILDFFDPRQAASMFDLLTRMAKISYVSSGPRQGTIHL